MKTLLALFMLIQVGSAFAAQGEAKTLDLPDFSNVNTAQSKTKVHVTAECGHDNGRPVLPGQSGFERCMPADMQLKKDYRGGGSGQ